MSELEIITINNIDYDIVDKTSRENSSNALSAANNALTKAEAALKTPSITYNSTKKAIVITTSEE